MSYLTEAVLLALIRGMGSLAVFEVFIRRFRPVRFLFGLKNRGFREAAPSVA